MSIPSEFLEEDFVGAFEVVLSNLVYGASHRPIELSRISRQDEESLGYDAKAHFIVPLYIQFKRSSFHPPRSTSEVIRGRDDLRLPTNRGVFSFPLHRSNSTGRSDQHNALYKLLRSGKRAMYVAPLFYKREHLRAFKRNTKSMFAKGVVVHDTQAGARYPFFVGSLRSFSDAISFPPHRIQGDSKPHRYSYDASHKIAFHSDPEAVNGEDGSRGFDEALVTLIRGHEQYAVDAEKHSDELLHDVAEILDTTVSPRSRTLTRILQNALANVDSSVGFQRPLSIWPSLSPVKRLRVVEEILRSEFSIQQFFLFLRK